MTPHFADRSSTSALSRDVAQQAEEHDHTWAKNARPHVCFH